MSIRPTGDQLPSLLVEPSRAYDSLADNALERFRVEWPLRSGIRREFPDFTCEDVSVDDYPVPDLADLFVAMEPDTRQRVLGAAWVSYNLMVAATERLCVLPVCDYLSGERMSKSGPVGIESSPVVFTEIAIDEEFHILGSLLAAEETIRRRELQELSVPTWGVLDGVEALLADAASGGQKDAATLAVGFVFEANVSDSLLLLANDRTIQPTHRKWARQHYLDERAHNRAFGAVFRVLVSEMHREEREIFLSLVDAAGTCLAASDGRMWTSILSQFGLAGVDDPSLRLLSSAGRRHPGDRLRVLLGV